MVKDWPSAGGTYKGANSAMKKSLKRNYQRETGTKLTIKYRGNNNPSVPVEFNGVG